MFHCKAVRIPNRHASIYVFHNVILLCNKFMVLGAVIMTKNKNRIREANVNKDGKNIASIFKSFHAGK